MESNLIFIVDFVLHIIHFSPFMQLYWQTEVTMAPSRRPPTCKHPSYLVPLQQTVHSDQLGHPANGNFHPTAAWRADD